MPFWLPFREGVIFLIAFGIISFSLFRNTQNSDTIAAVAVAVAVVASGSATASGSAWRLHLNHLLQPNHPVVLYHVLNWPLSGRVFGHDENHCLRKDESQKQELAWVAKADTDSGQDRQQGLEGQRHLHISQSWDGLGIIAPPETVQTAGSCKEVSPLGPVDSSAVVTQGELWKLRSPPSVGLCGIPPVNKVPVTGELLFSLGRGKDMAVDRRALCDELRMLHWNFGSEAWLLWGDFNSIGSVTEKSYVENLDMSAMVEFNGCVGDVDTGDLTAKGFFFTWSSRGGCMGDRKSKIDKAMDSLGTEFAERREGSRILQDLSNANVPEELKIGLIMPVLAEYTRRAMFSIKGDKAPKPDGFNASFSHNNWDVVGTDVVLAAQSFFSTGFLLKDWNSTALTIVPKTGCPSSTKDYRPIAWCNVIYKCLTKILSSRLQSVLPFLMSQSQYAFIKKRSITDNILHILLP
ncbi:hypothetical protein Acr_14g0003100 [Actinidia rufa]|uniref:Reverse transcriptase domain-containing protein n=1 Tax=Actinidia rufa TaxID=165716 RepID=A0A7J0FPN4_9ERIC|nr:hypothetical protein Acr_14g0003100 [Actinidia rufa]